MTGKLIYKWSATCLILLIIIVGQTSFAQDYKNEKQLIKGANDQFDAKNYVEAIPLFSTLVSNYPKDPTYNYKYGASLLYGGADKEKPIKYLKFAVSRPEVEPIAFFYYAEALHLNYEFDQAIKYYRKFTAKANNSTIKKNTVENQIRQCENGKTLLKTITDLIVLDQKKTLSKDFYKVYDLSAQGGQILVKTDDFRSPYEMKNDINGIFYFPKNAQKIFFSSHTLENRHGKDIYYAIRNDDGSWSKPISIGKPVNTEFDEDFPYLAADGITLYFASQGHNSLGGYDIFVTRLDTNSGSWTTPQNLDFAINTPSNDYLFIPDQNGETAYFASERQTPVGEVSVYQINMERVPLDFTFIFGSFSSETTKNAKIKVENVETNAIIGEYNTDAQGKYKIKLPNDGKFRFIVDYEGSQVSHSGEVDLNDRNTFKPLKQEMLVMGQGTENEKLIIKNLVDEEVEEDVALTAEFFKEKAKLKVNKDKFKDRKPKLTTPVVAAAPAPNASQDQSAIAENKQDAGKAGSSIADEKIVDQGSSQSDGPNLTVNEDTGTDVSPELSQGSKPPVAGEEGKLDEGSTQLAETGAEAGTEAASNASPNANSDVAGNQGVDLGIAPVVKLKPTPNSSKAEIQRAMDSNVEVAKNSAALVGIQSESAQNVADRKTMEAAKLKAEANNELALIDIETEDGLNSEEYINAQRKIDAAKKLELQASIANNAASSLKSNQNALNQISSTGNQKKQQVESSEQSAASSAVVDYNSQLESQADNSYNIYEERAKVAASYKEEEKEHKHFADELAALQSEIKESEVVIAQKEKDVESAGGKDKKRLEEELVQERAALKAMKEKSRVDEEELLVLEAEAEEERAQLEAFDAIIEDLENSESYAELKSKPNLIDGNGSLNKDRSTSQNLIAGANTSKNSDGQDSGSVGALEDETSDADEMTIAEKVAAEKEASAGQTQPENSTISESDFHEDVKGANENAAEVIGTIEHESGEQMVAQQRTSSSQEASEDILDGEIKAPLAAATLPAKYDGVSKEVPEVDAKYTLFPDLDETDSLSAEDQALMPTEESTTSAFIPENSLAALENSDQSLRAQMKTNYHQAYMEEFFEIAEEEDEYTKTVNTYILNQSWALDIQKEIDYLDNVKGDLPEDKFTVAQERITVLEGFKETKLKDMESSKEKLDGMSPSGSKSAPELAVEFRSEMNRVFDGKSRLSDEEIAEEKQRRADAEAQRKAEMAALVAQNQTNENQSNNNGSEVGSEAGTNEQGDIGSDVGAENGAGVENSDESSEIASEMEGDSGNSAAANAGDEIASNDFENGGESQSGESQTTVNSADAVDGNNVGTNGAVSSENTPENEEFGSDSGSDIGAESGLTESSGSSSFPDSDNANSTQAGTVGSEMGNETASNSGQNDAKTGSNTSGASSSNSNATGGSTSAENVAYSSNGEIIPNQNEDKLAEVLNMENAGTVEAIVTEYTEELDKEEAQKKEIAETERKLIQDKQKEFNTAKKKRKKVLEAEIREEEQIVELMEKEAEMLEYNKAAVARAADNVLALSPGEERDSEKELKKAETISVQAEETRAQANARATEKVRGKKKTKAKLDEVDDLNHRADKLEYEANSLKKLSKELAKIEEEVLSAEESGGEPATLPKSTRQISQAEVQEIQSTSEYAEYDATRKEAVKSYKTAQVLYQEKMSLEAQNKVIDAEIQNVRSDIESTTDETQKQELKDKLEELKTSKVDNTKLMDQKEAQAKKNYAQFNKLNNQAINSLKSVEGKQGEKLIALANIAEKQGAYSLTGTGETELLAAGRSQNDGVSETGYSPEKFNRVVQGIDNYPAELSDAIFKMIDFNESLYSEDNPIPMDNKLPTGLVYKVQIGAFRNPPPQDIYKGFAPVRGENTRPGWIRYTAGLFQNKNQARLKRNEIRTLGYEDAFVVAYLNGERISLARAKDIETGVEKVPQSTSNALANGDMPTPVVPTSAVSGQVQQLSDIKGLMYTVQVGAFRNQVTSNELFGISPLIEYRAGDYYKYGSGIYNDINKASEAKSKIQALGVSDAFVTAFYNGNRVSMEEAQNLANGGSSFATEQPVTVNTPSGSNAAGINFRVQVGAYRQEVPLEDAKIILSLSNIGLDTKQDGDMTYYTAGNYSSYAEAKQMQTQVVNQGLSGAFVVALRNGVKIDLQEAIKLAGQ